MVANGKTTVLGLLTGAGLFALITLVFNRKKDDESGIKQPPITDEHIEIAVSAYKEAMSQNEDNKTMTDLNDAFKKDYGFTIVSNKEEGTLTIRNLSGYNVKTI